MSISLHGGLRLTGDDRHLLQTIEYGLERAMTLVERNGAGDATPVTPLLLGVREAARMLGIGRSTLYELIAAGEIETVHIGRAARVPVAALHAFVERRRTAQVR
jgi:excisionase family DNA binding protein